MAAMKCHDKILCNVVLCCIDLCCGALCCVVLYPCWYSLFVVMIGA